MDCNSDGQTNGEHRWSHKLGASIARVERLRVPHPYLSNPSKPRVFAHRGLVTPAQEALGIAENSRRAVTAAVDAGALYVESDCHLTLDGVVVLFHDSDLKRVTGDPRAVADVLYAELFDLMSERGGLLTLREALDEFPETRFNIDAKSDAVAEPAGTIIGEYCERVLLASFSDAHRSIALAAAQRAAAIQAHGGPQRPATSPGRAALVRVLLAANFGTRRAQERSLEGFDALQIPEKQGVIPILNRRLIRAAHRVGVEVHIWTVNDPVRMKKLVALGVDGIITDRADLAFAELG